MKKILFVLFVAVVTLSSCDYDWPLDNDQYPQKVYIVGAHEKILYKSLDLSNDKDTVSMSLGVSGSLSLSKDVMATIGQDSAAVMKYNDRELSAEGRHFNFLSNDIYSIPNKNITVKAGNATGRFDIYVNPKSLECDSMYMMGLRVKSTSAYDIAEGDTTVLVRFSLANKYSGQYYMDGMIKNLSNPNDSLNYVMPRYLSAIDDGKTIRMFHYRNEWNDGTPKNQDYRSSYTFKIKVNDDNTLSFSTFDKFNIIAGGGVYHPDMKIYELWYEYVDPSTGDHWKTVGYLYKECKTSDELRIVKDWIEEQRSK